MLEIIYNYTETEVIAQNEQDPMKINEKSIIMPYKETEMTLITI